MSEGFVRWCNVYLEVDGGRVIVASCFNHDGMSAEMPDESVVLHDRNEAALGRSVLSALEACVREKNFNYRNSKRSDWPAYQISTERSIRSFEHNWLPIQVRGANDTNATWELIAPIEGDYSVALTAVVSPVQDEVRLGAAINYLGARLDQLNA